MPVKTIDRNPTDIEWDFITFIEEHWHKHNEIPEPTEVAKVTGFSNGRVGKLFNTDICIAVLENRGIPLAGAKDRKYLRPDQLAAINTYLNFTDTRPLERKLKDLNIPLARFYGWMKNKNFREFLRARSEEGLEDAISFAHRELVGKAGRGDLKAIKLLYEITGRHTGIQSTNQQNIRLFILQVIEIIQKHVQDPVKLQLIAADFEGLFGPSNRSTTGGFSETSPVGPAALPVGNEESSSPVGNGSANFPPVGEKPEISI